MNKFEQVSVDEHQMSVDGGEGRVSQRDVGYPRVDIPYHVTYPIIHVMLPNPRQND